MIGFFVDKSIKAYLFNGPVVASAFIVGGLIILWVEKRANPAPPRIGDVDQMTPLDALKVGFVQCLGMIPGTSRSGATIIGGMLLGLSRKAATDFSFFLAIPTLVAAGGYSLFKEPSCSRRRRAAVRGRLRRQLHRGLVLRALAAALHLDPHLRAVRVVPDRLRHRRAGDGLERARRLGRLSA